LRWRETNYFSCGYASGLLALVLASGAPAVGKCTQCKTNLSVSKIP
jgi:hypothetical protein